MNCAGLGCPFCLANFLIFFFSSLHIHNQVRVSAARNRCVSGGEGGVGLRSHKQHTKGVKRE